MISQKKRRERKVRINATDKTDESENFESEEPEWLYCPPPPLNLEKVFQGNRELIRIFYQVREVIVRALSALESHVTPTATFDGDLQADSLGVIELFMAIEEEFDIEIPEEEIEKMRTVRDVVSYIEQEIASTPSSIPAPS